VIGLREVRDRTDRDTISVNSGKLDDWIKISVYRNPVHFIDVDIRFRNGGR
jgi:hypothetical protein